ncbi:hypothetical protein ASD52_24980 [Ensifer sp. Root142]|nr:hypothetical protein ASD00_21745 [Ensifer sp. Root31]KQY74920.1 hypothetical protein ASD52_24980 [Ensifer sp. Root142]PSS62066.1 hypothetical protein C6558_25135 [Ensifer sp. NM-2]
MSVDSSWFPYAARKLLSNSKAVWLEKAARSRKICQPFRETPCKYMGTQNFIIMIQYIAECMIVYDGDKRQIWIYACSVKI